MNGDERPGRHLDRPPGERFARPPTTPDEAAPGPAGSAARAVAFAVPAALIALFAGRVIGLSARTGGGNAITSDQSVVIALLVTLAWFVLAQVGTWLYARSEGGDLQLVDYLFQAFGPIVPLAAVAAALAAWWSAR